MDWFETWFDTPYYHILYHNHDYREAEEFILKLTADLRLAPHSTIIDLACGKGRHSVFLNRLGYHVLGLDLSLQSIEYDRKFENDTLKFRVHDMREKIPGDKVDAVFNLFTSFGYFEREEDDQKVFNSVAEILKPNGFFVLDYLNETVVRNSLIHESTVERGGILFEITKKIEDNFVIKNISFKDNGQSFNFFERVKLHTAEKIASYAAKAGMEAVKVWGDYDLSEFHRQSSPRCITLFRKL